jgi:antitoxin HicB
MSTAVKRSSHHDAIAVKQVLSSAVRSKLKAGLTKTVLARKLATSRPAIDRVLDPRNTSITLRTFVETAAHVGYRVRLTLEPRIESVARVPAPRSSARLMKKLGEALDRIPAAGR